MKRLLTTMIALTLCAATFAQYNSGGFAMDGDHMYYGIRFGVNRSHIAADRHNDLDGRTGMTLGGVVGLRCSNSTPVFLESGLYYTERGGKKFVNHYGDVQTRLSYLELPVLIKYGITLNPSVFDTNELVLLPFVGPTFAFGVGGKTKITDMDGERHKHDAFGSKDNRYKRFDMGFKFGVGLEYNMLYLELGYQLGVANISNDDNYDAHTRNFFCNVGINF